MLPGTTYYVGVRAINALNMSSTVISDGFLLDADKPLGGHVFNTHLHNNRVAQSDTSSIGVSWHGFQDHHSYISRYHVNVIKESSSEDIFHSTVTLLNSLNIDDIRLEHGHRYLTTVTAEDSAGHLGATVHSPPILIDATQPVGFVCRKFEEIDPVNIQITTNKVSSQVIHHIHVGLPVNDSDMFRVRISVATENLDGVMASFSVGRLQAETPFVMHERYDTFSAEYEVTRLIQTDALQISFQNNVEIEDLIIKIESCSRRVVVFGAEAVTLKQHNPSLVSICSRVMDAESGLKNILIGVGTTPGGYQVPTLRPTIARFHELLQVNLPHGALVYTTVIAENHSGLKTVFLSNPIIIDHTPPTVADLVTETKYVLHNDSDAMDSEQGTEQLSNGNDTDSKLTMGNSHNNRMLTEGNRQIVEDVLIEANWQVTEEHSALECCWCSLGYSRQSTGVHPWTLATNHTSCLLPVNNATHGQRVHLNIQCINTVGLVQMVSSLEHLIILRAPCSNGSQVDVLVQNTYRQHGIERVQSASPSVKFQWTWQDHDTVSHYQCRADGGHVGGWSNTSVPFCELTNVDLTSGGHHTVEVRAVNERDMVSDGISAQVNVDNSVPTLTGSRAEVVWRNNVITADLRPVFHHASGQLAYTISAGSNYGYNDYVRSLQTANNTVTFTVPEMTSEVHVTVTAEAPVGSHVIYTDVFHKNL